MTEPRIRMRDADALLQEAFRVARLNAFEWDVVTDRMLRAGEFDSVFNLTRAEVGETGAAYMLLAHEHDRERFRAAIDALTPEQPELEIEYRLALPGGAVRWVQDTARGAFDEGRNLIRLSGMTMDITPQKEAEARLILVRRVSELIGEFEDPAELLYEVSRTVGEHLHVRRCLFTEIDIEKDRGTVRRDYCLGVPSVAGVYKVSDYSESTRREMSAGHTVVNCDSKNDARTAEQYVGTYQPQGERSYIAVPMLRDGRWVAELWISDDVPRHWSEQDVALLQSVAERVWTAVEKLRVHEALRQSEARVRFVGERADVGYWYWDLLNNQMIWSPVCKRLFGLEPDVEITHRRFRDALHPDDRDLLEQTLRASLEGDGEYDLEYRTIWPDGTVRWVRAKGSASYEEGVPVRMAGITLDVTQRRMLDEQRDELLALERRLREEADEASVAKDHFLALLSHELRTPMTTILGWASFLASGMADQDAVQSGIQSIEQSSRAQARLIEDLLDVSRIVTGKLTLERKLFDLTEPVRDAVEVVLPSAREKTIEIITDFSSGPAFVHGDASRMEQVAWNLLTNSVKFTPPGGRVYVRVTQSEDGVRVCVRDTGAGMPADFLPHVFERFRQGEDGPSRSFGGLGLGLSIVRNVTELHGGSVEAVSDGLGRGAEFIVRLPRALAPTLTGANVSVDAREGVPSLTGVNVLLVDDDPAARKVLSTMLAGYGASVAQAASAHEALQSLGNAPAHVVVSDIGMPGQDGYELMRLIRNSESDYSRVPAIAVTAYADPHDRDRALDSGYQAHLAKPVEARALASAVLDVLRGSA